MFITYASGGSQIVFISPFVLADRSETEQTNKRVREIRLNVQDTDSARKRPVFRKHTATTNRKRKVVSKSHSTTDTHSIIHRVVSRASDNNNDDLFRRIGPARTAAVAFRSFKFTTLRIVRKSLNNFSPRRVLYTNNNDKERNENKTLIGFSVYSLLLKRNKYYAWPFTRVSNCCSL